MDFNVNCCTEINPGNIWSKQHYSQSCYTACLAMLLKNRGIEIDDRAIVELVHTPILIEYDSSVDSFKTSFCAYQEQIQAIVCVEYGLSYRLLTSKEISNSDYCDKIIRLLEDTNEPLIVGVMSDLLPDFDLFPDKHPERHAIVVYDFASDVFHCLNPATISCLKKSDQDFDTVKYQVNFTMSATDLHKASIENHVSWISEAASKSYDNNELVLKSSNVINTWNLQVYEALSNIFTNNNCSYADYKRFRQNYINPFIGYMRSILEIEFSENLNYLGIAKCLNELFKSYKIIDSELIKSGCLSLENIDNIYGVVNKCANSIGKELRGILA